MMFRGGCCNRNQHPGCGREAEDAPGSGFDFRVVTVIKKRRGHKQTGRRKSTQTLRSTPRDMYTKTRPKIRHKNTDERL